MPPGAENVKSFPPFPAFKRTPAVPMTEAFLSAVRAVVGDKGLLTDASAMEPHLVEERGLFRGAATAVARPAST